MTETKHTPGPWEFEPHNLFGSKAPDGSFYPFGYISTSPISKPIFSLETIFFFPKAELAANSRLIAAAPDMLDALRSAAGFLHNARIDLTTGASKQTAVRTIDGGLKLVEAAIAKATGEPALNKGQSRP